MTTRANLCGLLILMAAGCDKHPSHSDDYVLRPSPLDQVGTPATPATPAAPAAPPSGMAAPAPAAGADDLSGTVVATMDSGGYTYAQVDHGGTPIWLAGPTTKLVVGDKLGAMQGQLMSGFRSNTLARTFDEIYFVAGFATGASPHGMADTVATTPASPHGKPAPVADVGDVKVAPIAGGTTIAAVYAGKATLGGKPIAVHGKVVKVNDGILGRNWIHLRDGTGADGTNDLLVTSASTANLGDVIVARGTIARDQDFGAGYKYDLVLADATITSP